VYLKGGLVIAEIVAELRFSAVKQSPACAGLQIVLLPQF